MEKANDRLSQEVIKSNVVESYRFVNKVISDSQFLNDGYYDVETGYSNQENLYFHLVRDMDISKSEILDVGCGRGGGLNLLYSKIGCLSATGIDITPENISFCKKTHSDKINFLVGDAEQLEFDDNSFDIVFNIESAHCYPNFDKFLSEVVRVLKPGGKFLFTDAVEYSSDKNRGVHGINLINDFPGLEVISETDITNMVTESCMVDSSTSDNWLVRELSKEKVKRYSTKQAKHLSFVCRKVG